jgi:hypothetical protein
MITLNKLAEQVMLQILGGDKSKDSELEMPDVVLLMRQVISEAVRIDTLNGWKIEGEKETSFHYIWSKSDIEVVWDKSTNQCYSIIPWVPLQLPRNRGIHEILPNKYPAKGGPKPFIPVLPGQISMVYDLIEKDDVVFWPEGSRVYYHKNITSDSTKVTMKIIVPTPHDLDPDTDFYLPDDMQAIVIMKVKQMLMPDMPQDKINNSNKMN